MSSARSARPIARRSLLTTLVVGSFLNLINQGDALLRRRVDHLTTRSYASIYHWLREDELLNDPPRGWAADWAEADADHFGEHAPLRYACEGGKRIRPLILLLCALLIGAPASAQRRMHVSLVPETTNVLPGTTLTVAFVMRPGAGWHGISRTRRPRRTRST